jgi:excisionase family DNA binding protein
MEARLNRPQQIEQNSSLRSSQEPKRKTKKENGLRNHPFRMDSNLCTSGQAAKLLGVPDRTIRRYLSTGKIDGVQNPITGTWQIRREALIRFIRERGCDFRQFPFSIQVLVVDDEPTVANSITRILGSNFLDTVVNVSRDACNALIEIGIMRPDLVILDARMPMLNGREILVAMKNNPATKDIKVLAVSGHSQDLAELTALGANEALFKPFSHRELLEKVEILVPFNNITEA